MCSIASLTPSTTLIERTRSEYLFFPIRVVCREDVLSLPSKLQSPGAAAHPTPGLAILRDHLRQKCRGDIPVDQQCFKRVAGGGILNFGIERDIERLLQIRVAVDIHVADAFAMAQHGDAAVLGDVADKFVRSARNDQIDFVVQRQDLRHVFARVEQNDGVLGNIRKSRQRIPPDGHQYGVCLGRFRAAFEKHRVARFQSARDAICGTTSGRAYSNTTPTTPSGHVSLYSTRRIVRAPWPTNDDEAGRGSCATLRTRAAIFLDSAHGRPQAGEHRAGQLAALDGTLRRRAIFFICRKNFR